MYLRVDSHGMPVRVFITYGTAADCKKAYRPILADRAHDEHSIIFQAAAAGMEIIVPPKKNRKEQREYDKHHYKPRLLVENAFLCLKHWHSGAAGYAKNAEISASKGGIAQEELSFFEFLTSGTDTSLQHAARMLFL